jgi:hypothetical protein
MDFICFVPKGVNPTMKQFISVVLLAASLCLGGCASSGDSGSEVPSGGGRWEYRSVMLEGASVGQINNQIHQWNLQGWEVVNNYVNVRRSGIGYAANVPMRRLKQ